MPFLGMYPKNALSYTETFFLNLLIIALLKIARIWKQPRCPTTDELWKNVVHLHNRIAGKRMELETYTPQKKELGLRPI